MRWRLAVCGVLMALLLCGCSGSSESTHVGASGRTGATGGTSSARYPAPASYSHPAISAIRTGCWSAPKSCAYPDATTTGVRSGARLAQYNGPERITEPGTVIRGVLVHEQLEIAADDVMIVDSKIMPPASSACETVSCAAVRFTERTHRGGVFNSEIDGNGGNCAIAVEAGGAQTVQGNNLHGCGDAVRGAGAMVGNYVHDLWLTGRVGQTCVDTPHNDGYQTLGQNDVIIRDNTIDIVGSEDVCPGAGVDACVFFGDETDASQGAVVSDNLFHCDAFQVRLSKRSSNMRVVNNRFVKVRGGYGPLLTYPSTPEYVFTGNLWDETGAAIAG